MLTIILAEEQGRAVQVDGIKTRVESAYVVSTPEATI
jgi:hypothetical protein